MKNFKLKEVCHIEKGKIGISKAVEGEYPLVITAEERSSHNEWHFDEPATIVPLVSSTGHGHASIKRLHYAEGKYAVGNILAALIPKNHDYLNAKYLYVYLTINKEELLVSQMTGAANVSLTLTRLAGVEIEIPDYETQLKVIKRYEDAESYKNKLNSQIDTRSVIIEKLRQQILQEKSSSLVKLGEHLVHIRERINENKPGFKMIGVSNENGITVLTTNKKDGFHKYKIVSKDSFIYNPMRINVGSIALYTGDEECITSPDYVVFKIKTKYPAKALLFYLKSDIGLQEIAENVQGSVRQRLYFDNLANVKVPNLPIGEYSRVNNIFEYLSEIELSRRNDLGIIDALHKYSLKDMFTV